MSNPEPTVSSSWPEKGLYVVTPETLSGAPLVEAVTAAVEHGARAVQYRDKSDDSGRRIDDAWALVEVCHPRGVPLIVNDDASLARAVGADGVHLGRDDLALAAARDLLGDDIILGVSCYDEPERARVAVDEQANYVAFGSFFSSTTKPGAVRAGPELVREVRESIEVPIVAIGGITAENAPALLEAGVDMLAVVNAVFGAETPDGIAKATKRLAALFD